MGEPAGRRGGNRLRSGRIALAAAIALVPPAAFAQERLSGMQISASAGAVSYAMAIPEIEQIEANLSLDRLKPIISSGAIEELATVKAKRIAIPTIVLTVTAPPEIAGQIPSTGISITDIVLSDVSDGRADSVAARSIVLRSPAGSFEIVDFTARNVDLSGLLSPPDRSAPINATVKKPGFAGEEMSFEIPDPVQPDHRIKLELLSLEAIVANTREGIPTRIDIEGIGLAFDLPAGRVDPWLAILGAAGVRRFNGTFRVAATWDESDNTVTIAEASLTGRDLGGVFLTAEIHNAGKALFSKNSDEVRSAASGLALRFITLGITDSGLGDRMAGSQAKARVALVEAAENAVKGLLGASDDAATLATAVTRFVAGASGSLQLTFQAKTPPGLGVADLADIRDNLPAILPRMRIDAEAR